MDKEKLVEWEKLYEDQEISKEQLLTYLREMWEIRYFENTVYDLLGRNIIKGASHLYAGDGGGGGRCGRCAAR